MLHLNEITYRIAGREILAGASAHVPPGHKVGVVGRNGAGKTTLLRLIAGELQADGGSIRLRRGARVGLLAQEAPAGKASLIESVLAADAERERLLAEADTATGPERIAEVHQRLADIGAHAAPARAARILAGLGFDETAQARPLDDFSGGWRMRVALAAMLFSEPDLLLLDEPTNYLDLEGAIWLESFLTSYPRTLLIVSHDRNFLNRVAGAILLVDEQKLTLYRGNYDSYERTRAEQLALQEKMRANQEAQRRHLQAFVDRFRYKASKARQAQSRLKALARMAPIAAVMEARAPDIRFPEPVPLAPPILRLEQAAVGYGATPVLSRLDLRLDMDDRIALLGRNGNGKSTLARLLAGQLAPMAGRIHKTGKLKVGHFAQHQIDALNPDWTAFRHMAAALPDKSPVEVRARLGAFGFAQAQADVAASELSGGEKARLVLALISAEAPGLLVLDEPSNHLDVDTREVLVRALNDFAGAIVLISHDRHLVELIADRLWLVAGGTVRPFDGDLDDYRRLVLGEGERPRDRESAAGRSASKRRGERRRAAETRRQLSPLRRRVREAEAAVERLTRELGEIDAELARLAAADDGTEPLVAVNKRRAEVERERAAAETVWLEAMDALEAAQTPSPSEATLRPPPSSASRRSRSAANR